MRKSDPNGLVASFTADTYQAWSDWVVIDQALAGHSLAIRRKVASDALLALAVTWEGFLSRWLIAAVNRDPNAAIQHLSDSVVSYATQQLHIPKAHIASSAILKQHFTVAEVQRILDPANRNIVLTQHKEFKDFGRQWLSAPYAAALAKPSARDVQVLKSIRSIRNALTHQSSHSLSDANSTLRDGRLPRDLRLTASRNLNVAGLGRYLHAGTTSKTRLEILHTESISIALLLLVP